MGSKATAAVGGVREPREWQRSVKDDGAAAPRTSAGHRNRKRACFDPKAAPETVFFNLISTYPGIAQLVARLLWELEHQIGSTAPNVVHSPLTSQLPLITSVESWVKMW